MYYLIIVPFSGEYAICSSSDLNDYLLSYGIVELLGNGSYLECESLRDELIREETIACLN